MSLQSLLSSPTPSADAILNAADTTLKSTPTSSTAQRARIIALLHLDRYRDALDTLTSASDILPSTPLEHAYALYKLGRLDEARDICKNQSSRGLQHVAAQAAYRAEDFVTASTIYAALASGVNGDGEGEDQHEADSERDVRVNALAAAAQSVWAGQTRRIGKQQRTDLEAFDCAFNLACMHVARGELRQADVLLKRARDLCEAEEMAEEDRRGEVAAIECQKVYVLLRMGKIEEARTLAGSVDLEDVGDEGTRFVAKSNLMVGQEEGNAYLRLREFNEAAKIKVADQPFEFQDSVLQWNRMAIDGAAGKRVTARDGHACDADVAAAGVFGAYKVAGGKSDKSGLKTLLSNLEATKDVGLVLTVVQMYITAGKHATAADVFSRFLARSDDALRFAPGIVAVTVALNKHLGRTRATRSELHTAAQHWLHSTTDITPLNAELLKTAGAALLPAHRADAEEIFQRLATHDSSDPIAKAGLAACRAQHVDLPSVASLTSGIDAAALENSGVPRVHAPRASIAVPKKRTADAPPAQTQVQQGKTKKIRTRASQLPKDFDANKTPDPERWLPMRDRSYYKPKKRKGKAAAAGERGGATQGGVAGVGAGVEDGSRPGSAAGVVQGKRKGKGRR